MSKSKINENFSSDEQKKQCLDTGGQSSSVDTDIEHLIPDTEGTSARAEAISGNSTLDTDDLDIPDTRTLARWDRESQGPWEAEYSYGGEVDLHQHYNNCAKNPGHMNFIPVDKFSIADLPEGYRDPDIVDYIRAESDLTVRVTVKYVSKSRPETVPGSDNPYPFYANRGQNRMSVGTGWVGDVSIYRDLQGTTCMCKDCRNSSTPETDFAVITIASANHVVFDEVEAEHTTCHLFFDRGGTPDTCSGVVTLTDMESTYSDIETDRYWMKHFTHDLHLGGILLKMLTQKCILRGKVSKQLPRIIQYKANLTAADKQPLLIIVSHPHGCSKYISIGHWTSLSGDKTGGLAYEYTTATCPGSSGAQAFMPHRFSPEGTHSDCVYLPGIHYGTSEEPTGVNYFKALAPWEAEYSYEGAADLHRHYDKCDKNPGHKNFIPVDKFSIEYLPDGYRDPDLVDYIRAEADLTVRVTVRYVSDRIPATPGSGKPYLGYANRSQNRMTVGTGWVDNIVIYRDDQGHACKCKDCQNSSTPETHFAVIYITTAKHVVFDDLEAEHSTCHLFFDSGGTPETCSGVVTLTDMRSISSDIETGKYRMQHFTHDLHLGVRLQKACTRHDNLRVQLDKQLPGITQRNPHLVEVADKEPLMFIVSHPHGCSKHISMGHRTSPSIAETGRIAYVYTTATCPGSSGARVVMADIFSGESMYLDIGFVPAAHCWTYKGRSGVNYLKEVNISMKHPYVPFTSKSMIPECERLLRKIQSGRIYPVLEGLGEDNFSCVDEEDPHKLDDTSQKHPGHQN